MKLKTHSGAKKRVRFTGRGKIKMQKAAHRHLLVNKNKRQKNLDHRGHNVHASDEAKLRALLPHG